jgi:hypothetical protein
MVLSSLRSGSGRDSCRHLLKLPGKKKAGSGSMGWRSRISKIARAEIIGAVRLSK